MPGLQMALGLLIYRVLNGFYPNCNIKPPQVDVLKRLLPQQWSALPFFRQRHGKKVPTRRFMASFEEVEVGQLGRNHSYPQYNPSCNYPPALSPPL